MCIQSCLFLNSVSKKKLNVKSDVSTTLQFDEPKGSPKHKETLNSNKTSDTIKKFLKIMCEKCLIQKRNIVVD